MPVHQPWPSLRLSRLLPGLSFLGITAFGFALGVISLDRGWRTLGLIGYWITALGVVGGAVSVVRAWFRSPDTPP